MKIFKACIRGGLAVAVVMAVASPSSALLDTRNCGKFMSKAAEGLQKSIRKAFVTCADAGRQFGAGTVKAADKCEKALDKVYGKNPATDDTKTAYGKYLAKLDALIDADPTKSKCDATTLGELGHIASAPAGFGPAAAEATGFAGSWLAVATEAQNYSQALNEGVDLFSIIDEMDDLTDISRPNIDYVAANLPQCRTHVCVLDTASSNVTVDVGIPVGIPVTGGTVAVKVCDVSSDPALPVSGSGFKFLINDVARTFVPPPALLGNTVCISQIRSQGYCACSPGLIPDSLDFCQDHLGTSSSDACTGLGVYGGGAESCSCGAGATFGAGVPCLTAGCTSCRETSEVTNASSRCHSSAVNSAVEVSTSGTIGTGDCVDLNTITIALVPSGAEGTDTIACTDDDLAPPLAAVTIPFTTGTASTTIKNRVAAQGSCSGGSTPGMNCAQNADCLGGTCSGAGIVPSATFSQTGVPAASCDVIGASNLSGVAFVGAFPALDTTLGPPFGSVDLAATFKLQCD